jgi:hypothetical protein
MQKKYWRNSNSAMDDGEALTEAGRALGPQVVISLFSGREVEAESWRKIAERYRTLTGASESRVLAPEAEAAGILAEVISASDPEVARALSRRISGTSECEFYTLAAEAIIWDRITRSNIRVAEPHARLADSLYALMPGYFQNLDNYLSGSLRIISEYITFFAYVDNVVGRFSEASSLTAGASHLMSKYGIYRYAESAVEIGDRVLAENSGATGRDAMGYWTVANNLTNLHIALAQDQPPASTREYGEALTCAEAALAALNAATGDNVPRARETTLQNLAQLHARLAADQANAAEHATEALRLAEEYASVASDHAGATQWAARISEALNADHPESRDAEYATYAAALEVEYLLAVERIEEWWQESARRIAAESGFEECTRIVGEILTTLYDELAADLDRVIPASGFDWSICKLLLALGAIASGRLGELTGELVRSWLTTTTAPPDKGPWTAYRARQYVSTGGEGRADRASALGRIAGLAMLVQSIEGTTPGVRFREMLRSHNTALLKRIIEARPLFQEVSEPTLSREADLNALQGAGQQIFRPPFNHANG